MTLSGSYTQAFSFSDVTHLEQWCTDKSMELILKKIESKTYSQRYRIFYIFSGANGKKKCVKSRQRADMDTCHEI